VEVSSLDAPRTSLGSRSALGELVKDVEISFAGDLTDDSVLRDVSDVL
jgi:hypothetical protein